MVFFYSLKQTHIALLQLSALLYIWKSRKMSVFSGVKAENGWHRACTEFRSISTLNMLSYWLWVFLWSDGEISLVVCEVHLCVLSTCSNACVCSDLPGSRDWHRDLLTSSRGPCLPRRVRKLQHLSLYLETGILIFKQTNSSCIC